MTCWNSVWSRAVTRARNEAARIDREVELLRQSLYNDVRMPTDALSLIIGQQLDGSVETRIAVDGHDVEVRLEDGIWRVLDPKTLTIPTLNTGSEHILALNASKVSDNQKQDAFSDILTGSSNTDLRTLVYRVRSENG